MSAEFWDDAIIIIFFFYGLAFYSMGLALWIESGRASELGFARSMRLLAGFGLLHGAHEWVDMVERGAELYYDTALPAWILWLRLAMLVTSFVALLAFGEHLLIRERYGHDPHWWITSGALVVYSFSAIAVNVVYDMDEQEWRAANDVLSRYLIGMPGAVLACWALWQQRRILHERGMGGFVRDVTVGAAALALYGLVGQVFTGESVIFPSNFINAALFQDIMGFPVQLFRAAMAAVVAVAMIRVLRALEVESQQRLETVEKAKLETERRSREELTRLNEELRAANEETARLLFEMRRRDALRGELLQRITAAQEAERKRIARELHDGTGQHLTGLGLGLRGLFKMACEDPETAAARLATLEKMATTALGELRHLINDLRPPQLDDMGLVAALRFMVNQFNGREENLTVELDVEGEPVALPSEIETTLFRIAQEGLTNVIKHSGASQARVLLRYADGGVSLRVRDDGGGFDAKAVLDSTSPHRAWGLIGMQERVNLINAKLFLDSAPGKGTTLTVLLEKVDYKDVNDGDTSVDD